MNLSDSKTASQGPRRISAMEAVLAHLRSAIENGEYAVGDKLPSEAELCRTLEVSRPVLREALRALQTMGLTVSKTGKGTFVVANTVEDPTFGDYAASDLLEVRRHVEIPVAGYAAVRRT
ncbi:MAG: FadR family transcriptional regulator, partial [Nonomuraea sp.]|nr:FadR family transcriptional regulator [Nonomuraea sp.]